MNSRMALCSRGKDIGLVTAFADLCGDCSHQGKSQQGGEGRLNQPDGFHGSSGKRPGIQIRLVVEFGSQFQDQLIFFRANLVLSPVQYCGHGLAAYSRFQCDLFGNSHFHSEYFYKSARAPLRIFNYK